MEKKQTKAKFRYQCYGCTNDIGVFEDTNPRTLTCPICKMTQQTREELYLSL